jgi:hypothetical protein
MMDNELASIRYAGSVWKAPKEVSGCHSTPLCTKS